MSPMQRYATLQPILDEPKTREVVNDLYRAERGDLEQILIDDSRVGMLFLKRVPYNGGTAFVEMIPSSVYEDSMTTLYEPHECFNSRGELARARTEMITIIEDLLDAMPGTLMVVCSQRKRPARLNELGTRQLFDLMSSMVNARNH